MALSHEQKKSIVAEVAEIAANAYSAIAAEYRGLTVKEMTHLRNEARRSGVYLRIVKNSIARRAIEGTEFECMIDGLTGPLILAFSQEDPGCAARVIEDFAKGHEKLEVKLVSISGKLLEPGEISTLAKMPTYDEAISTLMSVMKAPANKLAQTLHQIPANIIKTLESIAEIKRKNTKILLHKDAGVAISIRDDIYQLLDPSKSDYPISINPNHISYISNNIKNIQFCELESDERSIYHRLDDINLTNTVHNLLLLLFDNQLKQETRLVAARELDSYLSDTAIADHCIAFFSNPSLLSEIDILDHYLELIDGMGTESFENLPDFIFNLYRIRKERIPHSSNQPLISLKQMS